MLNILLFNLITSLNNRYNVFSFPGVFGCVFREKPWKGFMLIQWGSTINTHHPPQNAKTHYAPLSIARGSYQKRTKGQSYPVCLSVCLSVCQDVTPVDHFCQPLLENTNCIIPQTKGNCKRLDYIYYFPPAPPALCAGGAGSKE